MKEKLTKSLISHSLVTIISIMTLANTAFASDMNKKQFLQSYQNVSNIKTRHIPIVYQAEQDSLPVGQSVLKKARNMSLDERVIVKGSCWDYLNAVFLEAKVKRNTIFKAKKDGGNYFNVDSLQGGDWLYYTNFSYHRIPHSGMFVGWVNKEKKQALMLSYAGNYRNEPARYRTYDISRIYNVMRPYYNQPIIDNPLKYINNSTLPTDYQAKDSKTKASKSVSSKEKKVSETLDIQAKDTLKLLSVSITTSTKPVDKSNKKPLKLDNTKVVAENKKAKKLNVQTQKPFPVTLSTEVNQVQIQASKASPLKQDKISKVAVVETNKYPRLKRKTAKYLPLIFNAEKNSSVAGRKILQKARQLTLDKPTIIVGTSENYIENLFNSTDVSIMDVYIGKYRDKSFFNPHQVRAGDWLSYINRSYRNVEHTGVFVGWVDKSKNKALILSYGGESRKYPARYRVYDIGSIYQVRRPKT